MNDSYILLRCFKIQLTDKLVIHLKKVLQINERPKAILYLVITATLWSLGGLLIKSVNSNAMAIAGTRSGIAALIILLATGKPKLNWSFAQIGAALSYSATVLLFVAANKHTTAANAILIQYTAPVYVVFLGAWLLKERVKWLDIITIFVVLGGMVLFFVDDISTDGMFGNILAAVSGIAFALFAVFMRMQKDGSPIESVLLGNILTAVIGIPFLFKDLPDSKGWLCLVLLGVIQLGISYILYSRAIKYVTALEATLIPIIEPILNPVWVFLLLGETPGKWALAGGIIVLAAVTGRCVLAIQTPANNTADTSCSGS